MIDLQEGEQILMTVRKHWMSIFTNAFVMLILAGIPIIVLRAVQINLADWFLQNGVVFVFSNTLFFSAGWVLFVWVMFMAMWTNYYLDVIVLTNKRIIDLEQFILFSRDEVTIPINRIEDIKIEVEGFLPTVLHYGNLQIQTAGAKRETVMAGIRNPEQIKAQIDRLLQTVPYSPVEPVVQEKG